MSSATQRLRFCARSGACLLGPEAGSARPGQVYGGAGKPVQGQEESVGCLKGVGGTVILGKLGGGVSAVPAGSLPWTARM